MKKFFVYDMGDGGSEEVKGVDEGKVVVEKYYDELDWESEVVVYGVEDGVIVEIYSYDGGEWKLNDELYEDDIGEEFSEE